MKTFWEWFEEIAYIYYMLEPYPAMLYCGVLLLTIPFLLSLVAYFRSRLTWEGVWYLVSFINFILNFLLSTQLTSLPLLISIFFITQLAAPTLFSHLLLHEE